jgi:hypothetical protein
LFGVRSSQGGLGSNKDEMVQAYDIFDETVLTNYQRILEVSFEKIITFAKVGENFKIEKMIPKALRSENEAQGGHPDVNIKDTKERVVDGIKKGGANDNFLKEFFKLIFQK